MAVLSTVWFALLALLGLSVRPDAPPTEATIGSSCRGLEVTDGTARCVQSNSGLTCDIFCDGQEQGSFTCTKGRGWTPELPTCARPVGDGLLPETFLRNVLSSVPSPSFSPHLPKNIKRVCEEI